MVKYAIYFNSIEKLPLKNAMEKVDATVKNNGIFS